MALGMAEEKEDGAGDQSKRLIRAEYIKERGAGRKFGRATKGGEEGKT